MNSIRLVLSLTASFKWEVHQKDVKSAFLHGDLHEEIYMEQSTVFIQTDSILVCRLKKSLYGLKKAPQACAKASPLLVGFTDSNWADDPDDQKSIAESEYRGGVEASKEALWLRQILSEFGFQQQHPTKLWCDNQISIQLCKDRVQHQCNKHIELHMHFIRKLIHGYVLEVKYCSTDDQIADIFTKDLTEAKFTKLRFMVGVQEVVTKGG
eukprot:PITA_03932